jgi:hypothetical protein
LNADNATNAVNVTGVVAIANGGTGSASQNFLDLTTDQTVAGIKTFTGTVVGGTVRSDTQFNLGTERALYATGGFIGIGPPQPNRANTFAGIRAGRDNTTGSGNSFFGSGETSAFVGTVFGTGLKNTVGEYNSFFGYRAGESNVDGSNNSYFGANAGLGSISGTRNTALGANANIGGNITESTAIGYGASVASSNTIVLGRASENVLIPGSANVTGATNATGGMTIGSGGTPITLSTKGVFLFPAGSGISVGASSCTVFQAPLIGQPNADVIVTAGYPAPPSGLMWGGMSSAGEVVFRICNVTAAPISLDGTSWNIRILQ